MTASAAASMAALPLADEQQPAPFLVKTYALVEDPQTDHTISWNSDGDAFVIWDPIAFASNLLPSSFKHNNLSSFIRQLNTYGFRKMVPDRWEFRNELFQRGKKHSLSRIHRRPVRSHPRSSRDCSPSSSSSSSSSDDRDRAMSSPSSHTERSSHPEAERLKKESQSEAERLKKENLSLTSELSRLRRLCSDLVLYIQRQVEKPQMMRDAIDLINPSFPGNEVMDSRHVSNSERRDRGSGEEEEEKKPGPFLSAHVKVPELAALRRFHLQEQSTSSRRSSSPPAMLFGVPMQHCQKRMRLSLSCDGEA